MINKYNYCLLSILLSSMLVFPASSFARGGGARAAAARNVATTTTTSSQEMAAAQANAEANAPNITPAMTTATTTTTTTRQFNPDDPYEPFNRVMYNFNDFVDHAVFKPVATVYNKIIPKPIIKGISNIFFNIDTVPTVANDLLQANFYQATSDTWRILINTTIGIGGFFDVASNLGLERNSEDLGLTFARWGWRKSDYLVIPFLGPTTVRDGIAWPINYQYLTIYPYIYPVRTRYVIYGASLVSKRADLLRFQDVMEQAAVDKYVFMRNAYMQRRAYKIEQNDQLNNPYMEKNDDITENKNVDDLSASNQSTDDHKTQT